ncbi:MAG: hypothetical protein HFF26_03635 [Oscillospiraceae bacterium]|nr:hypothetical protein [Oscillospiraceae bacterium]
MDRPVPAPLVRAFLAAEGGIYALFLTLDLMGRGVGSVPVKYAGVLLCLALSLLCPDRLVPLALFLTACADWFLLVRNDHYALGIALFLCVQTVYFLRLRRNGAGNAWPLRSGLALLAGLAVYAAGMASPLNLLAALYFSQLLSNAVLAWAPGDASRRRFALGLTLFVGCDVCVGLFNVLPPASPLYAAVSVGMWLFYLPSQVLITLSALPETKEAF